MKKNILKVIILCLCIIFLKNQYSSLLLKRATYGMPALIKKGTIENLYIGSSMFRQGLDISTLEQRQEDNYILAYNGNQPVWEYLQLEYLLAQGVEIENLYLDMYVYSAWSEPKIQDEKLFLEIGLNEKIQIWNILNKNSQSTFLDFWRIFISSNNELLLTWPINNSIINNQFYKGGTNTTPQGATADTLMALNVPQIDNNMNTIQMQAIENIISLCNKNNINLYFIETPKFNIVIKDTNYLNAMKEFSQFLTKANIPVLLCENTYKYIHPSSNIDFYQFDCKNANYYIDLIHLSYDGRVEFSKIISP